MPLTSLSDGPQVGFAVARSVLVFLGAIGFALLGLLGWGTYLLVRQRRSRRAEPR